MKALEAMAAVGCDSSLLSLSLGDGLVVVEAHAADKAGRDYVSGRDR